MGRVGAASRGLVWGAAPSEPCSPEPGRPRRPPVAVGVGRDIAVRRDPVAGPASPQGSPGGRPPAAGSGPIIRHRLTPANSLVRTRRGRPGPETGRTPRRVTGIVAGTLQSQVLNRFRRYLEGVRGWHGGVRRATQSVGSMDATKALEDGTSGGHLPFWPTRATPRLLPKRDVSLALHRLRLRLLGSSRTARGRALADRPTPRPGTHTSHHSPGRHVRRGLCAVRDRRPRAGRAALPGTTTPSSSTRCHCSSGWHFSPRTIWSSASIGGSVIASPSCAAAPDEGGIQRRVAAFAAALAATLFRELLGTRSPVSLLGWAAAAVAVMANEASSLSRCGASRP